MNNESASNSVETSYTYRRLKIGLERPSTNARYSIFLIRAGEATLTSGTKRYSLLAGDIAVTVAGKGYTLESSTDGCVADEVSFRTFIIGEKMKNALKYIPAVLRSNDLSAKAVELIDKMGRESKNPDEFSDDAIIGLIHILLVAIARHGNAGEEPSKLSAPVATALSHVNDHLGERLMLGDVAAVCEVSTAYLSRRFKSEVGIGFADYVAKARLERAGSMLREHPELSITEVAFTCGFNDSNYFSDKFKRHFGISPIKFRKR